MLLPKFCKLHFVTKQFHVNRCTLVFLLQRIKYKTLSRSYQYFLSCWQKVSEQLASGGVPFKQEFPRQRQSMFFGKEYSHCWLSVRLYTKRVGFLVRGPSPWYGPYFSWTFPLVRPLFFVDLSLGMAPIFVSLSSLSMRSFVFKKSIVSEFSIKSEIRGFYYISIDEEAVESNNMVWVRCLNETVRVFLIFSSHKKMKDLPLA